MTTAPRNMPLPQALSEKVPKQYNKEMHTGLWFDKFFDKYDATWQVPKDDSGKLAWIKTVTETVGDQKVAAYAGKQKDLVKSILNGESFFVQTDWHFATGLGNNHPVENGFSWHPTLGVPYLTGAAVKGLLRAWCEVWKGWKKEPEKEKKEHPDKKDDPRLLRWFGDETQAGEVIFFDALPTKPVKLKADVMTPHYGKWYEEGDKTPKKEGSNLPADWHNPVPIPFLVVAAGESFQFSVATRPHSNIVVEHVVAQLKLALEFLGAGAKTAVGYGRMTADTSLELDPFDDFKSWFEAQKFGGSNRGRHATIIDKINKLSNPQEAKKFVLTKIKQRLCTPKLKAFLNEK